MFIYKYIYVYIYIYIYILYTRPIYYILHVCSFLMQHVLAVITMMVVRILVLAGKQGKQL